MKKIGVKSKREEEIWKYDFVSDVEDHEDDM